MSGLRFCMVTTFYPPFNFGGDGIAIQRLARALARRGHSVTVIHDEDAYNALASGAPTITANEPPGIQVHGLRSGVGWLSPLVTHQLGRPLVNRKRIREILADGSFDVINFHNVSLVGGPGVLAEGNGLKVYTAHEHWLVCPTHVLWRHGRERCDGRQCLRCVAHYRRPPQLWRYTGYLKRQLRHVDLFIAKSEFSRGMHREFGFEPPMEVVPYFLPDAEPNGGAAASGRPPSPGREGASQGAPSPHPRPYFLFVGRLESLKGLQDVIPLFARYPEADLLIAGAGTYGDRLRELAAGMTNVVFLGRLDGEQLQRYYRHTLALIVPSLGYETFGIIIIEAFRAGVPVIARRIGPFPEIIERAGAGALFDDEQELLAAMRGLQQGPDAREELGRRARRAFENNWSESAVVPIYLGLLERTAADSGRARLAESLRTERVA